MTRGQVNGELYHTNPKDIKTTILHKTDINTDKIIFVNRACCSMCFDKKVTFTCQNDKQVTFV